MMCACVNQISPSRAAWSHTGRSSPGSLLAPSWPRCHPDRMSWSLLSDGELGDQTSNKNEWTGVKQFQAIDYST